MWTIGKYSCFPTTLVMRAVCVCVFISCSVIKSGNNKRRDYIISWNSSSGIWSLGKLIWLSKVRMLISESKWVIGFFVTFVLLGLALLLVDASRRFTYLLVAFGLYLLSLKRLTLVNVEARKAKSPLPFVGSMFFACVSTTYAKSVPFWCVQYGKSNVTFLHS